MILENAKRDVALEGVDNTYNMNISLEAQSHIIKLVTEYAYSQPLESGIRETLSNNLDSVQEAGTNEPVIVSFKQVTGGNYELSFEDKGLGLSKESFYKYIMGIGESTKRNNPSLRGGYGAGSKSWLAFCDSYFYTCRKDGVECKFMIFKGEEFPQATLLYEKETTEANGVIVTVPIKSWNRSNVKEAIKQQCSYFKNVWFDIEGFDNSYQIYENEHFKFNQLDAFDKMHIVLLDVAYPLNFSKLGISDIYVPVALRFDNYDDIKPDFTRENIQYNKQSIEAIKNKIKQVSEWFINKYNEDVKEFQSLRQAWQHINETNKYVTICDKQFEINDLEQFSDVKCNNIRVKDINYIPLERFKSNYDKLVRHYKIVADLKYGKTFRIKNASSYSGRFLTDKCLLLNRDVNLTGWFKEYLKTLNYNVFVKYDLFVRDEDLKWYKQWLHLQDYPKNEWRNVIKEWQRVRDEFVKTLFTDGRDLHLSKEFLEWKEANKTRPEYRSYTSKRLDKQKGDVTIHHVKPTYHGNGYKFEKKVHPLQTIHQSPHKYVVFNEEQKELTKYFHKNFQNFRNYKFVHITKGEIKKLPKTKQFIMFARLKEKPQDLKLFQRISTAILYDKAIQEFENITEHIENTVLQDFSNNLYENINKLKQYRNKYRGDYKDHAKAILEKAYELQDFDLTLDAEYQQLKQFNQKFGFIQFLKCNRYNKEEFVKELNKQLLFRKLRYEQMYDEFEICVVNKQPEVVEEQVVQAI